jgi:cytochrome c553
MSEEQDALTLTLSHPMGEGTAFSRLRLLPHAFSDFRRSIFQEGEEDSPSTIGWERAGVRVLLAALLLTTAHQSYSADLTPSQLQFFENKIRPVLADHCYKCHSQQAEKVRGGLLLDTRDGMLKGGDSGPAIVPGDPEKSLLIKAVRYTDPDLQMPPKDKKLSDAQIADLEAWVKMGAPDPRLATAAQKAWVDPNKKHWAWQPLTKPGVPEVKDSAWAKTPVDRFILAKLDEKGMKPNPPADKRTLIRRATFDLIGLPPTPEEVQDFLNDNLPQAFGKVVDRLLASPHYGERWGRHWLDVARYSDTKGQIRRQREDPNNPYAWTYRDYVIRSFNEDNPYNVFVIEQLAADKLPATAKNQTNLTALGFLTVGDRFMGMQNDIINDRIDVVTKGFLGLTVTCARCHDHKFDPIPTTDYYSLHGVFASSVQPRAEPVIQKISQTADYKEYYQKRNELDQKQESLEAEFRNAQRSRNRDRELIRRLQREFRETAGAISRLEMTHPGAPVRAMAIYDAPRPKDSPVLIRGEAGNRGANVPRQFLEVLSGPTRAAFTNGSGRLDLAHAIVNKNNPLTPRVMVNRVWLHHFGEGFVPTPDDLGTMSEPPSHPELIDYLASQFVEDGWSIKKLHRLIMLSSVYQQSSANNPRYAEIDPGNRLLWRANIRRLEFESVRDSLLAIGGTLDRTMYGRPVDFSQQSNATRRSIYGLIDRSDVDDVLVNFDFANPDMPNGKRHETTVPQQALFFMNSSVVIEQAKRLVALPEFKTCKDDEARIQFLYERIYQRLPRAEEVRLGQEFVAETPPPKLASAQEDEVRPASNDGPRPRPRQILRQQMRRGTGEDSRTPAPLMPWEEYAHALLQANETSFVN